MERRSLRRGLTRREFIVGTAAAAAAAACAPGTAPSGAVASAGPAASGPVVPAGTITLGLSQEIKDLDPALNAGFNDRNHLYTNLYSFLVRRAEGGKLVPDLAERWEAVGPTEWVFHLRKGVKFHNGDPFTAASVKGTIERYHESGKERFATVTQAFKGADVIDDHTVKIITTKVEPLVLERAYKMAIVPHEHIKKVGDAAFFANPIGTGPFKFVRQVKGDRVILEANMDYYAGPPKLREVHLRVIPEIATRISALRAGEVDLIVQMPPDQVSLVEADPNLRVASVNSPRVIFLEFYPNTPAGNGKPFLDLRVRQALNHAINFEPITKSVLNGLVSRVATLVAPEQFGYDGSVSPYSYDPQKARQLLEAAGYTNLEVPLQVPTGGNPLKPVEVGQAIAADWQKIGLTVKLQTVETNTYSQLKTDYKIGPVFMWNWAGFDADEPIWGNASNDSTWSYWPGRMPPKMAQKDAIDRLIDEERSIVDGERRKALLSQIQHKMKDDAAYIPMYQQKDIYAVSRKVRNWEPVAEGPVHLWDVSKP